MLEVNIKQEKWLVTALGQFIGQKEESASEKMIEAYFLVFTQ